MCVWTQFLRIHYNLSLYVYATIVNTECHGVKQITTYSYISWCYYEYMILFFVLFSAYIQVAFSLYYYY